jgi:hypothetical protein
MNLPLGCFISQTPLLTFDDTRDTVVTLTVVVFFVYDIGGHLVVYIA